MLVLPRWRKVLIFKNSFVQATIATSSSSTNSASFHSTPTCLEKWKKKWDPDVNGQQPSKSYIRYKTRQKRADAKNALNNLLFNSGGSSKITFEDIHKMEDHKNRWEGEQGDHSDRSDKKSQPKSSSRHAKRALYRKRKSKIRRGSCFEDFDEHPEPIFQATFGNRCYTWSFKSWGESNYESSTYGFEWREHPKSTNDRNKEWDTENENESDGESCFLKGSCSDRTILGLPLKGALKIEEVKTAFRLSALKWHPDKHQGPSQAMAEEKFKHCVNAYKSLCSALSSS